MTISEEGASLHMKCFQMSAPLVSRHVVFCFVLRFQLHCCLGTCSDSCAMTHDTARACMSFIISSHVRVTCSSRSWLGCSVQETKKQGYASLVTSHSRPCPRHLVDAFMLSKYGRGDFLSRSSVWIIVIFLLISVFEFSFSDFLLVFSSYFRFYLSNFLHILVTKLPQGLCFNVLTGIHNKSRAMISSALYGISANLIPYHL